MLSPWSLSWVAVVLFVLYATIVLGSAFPIRLLDPTWQLKILANLVNASAFPLVGLGLLQLASDLNPYSERLERRLQLCASLAVPVALGFLLLIPLQPYALWQQSSTAHNARLAQVQRTERTIAAVRQAMAAATTPADLKQRLTAIQGPDLGPVEEALPLPVLKAQIESSMQQLQSRIQNQKQAIPASRLWDLVAAGGRNGVACLALACGFAALGRRSHSELPLLEELLGLLDRLRFWQPQPGRGHRASAEGQVADYIKEISRGDS